MLLLRLAALVQVTFLPGYLLLDRAGFATSHRIQTIVRSFAASLILNWMLVYLLTVTGLYRPVALYVVFAAECAWFLRLQWGKRFSGDLRSAVEPLRGPNLQFQLALVVAVATAGLFVFQVVQNRDTVFRTWDVVVSWNRWALDWAENRLPQRTWHYPQLVPASWSLLYVFSRDTVVQSPARIVQALYPLAIVLTLLDAGLRHRSARVLLAIPIWAALAHLLATDRWDPLPLSGGLADIPVAFFGLLAVVTALYAEERAERTWWLALFFACGAALTKQAGLFALVFVWILALLDLRSRKFALRSAALVLALVGSWYVMKEIQIHLGSDQSEVVGVGAANAQRGGVQHALERLRLIPYVGRSGWMGGLMTAALMAVSLRDPRQRKLVLGLVLPFVAIWLFLYSYDTRNAWLAVPFIALSLAHALPRSSPANPPAFREVVFTFKWLPSRLQLLGSAVAAVGLVGAFAYSEEATRNGQIAQQREIGFSGLNAALYRFFDANPIHGKVLTSYQILGFLPGFRDRMIVANNTLDVADLWAAEQNPEVVYILTAVGQMHPDAAWLMEERVRTGRYRHVFDEFIPMEGLFATLVQIRP